MKWLWDETNNAICVYVDTPHYLTAYIASLNPIPNENGFSLTLSHRLNDILSIKKELVS